VVDDYDVFADTVDITDMVNKDEAKANTDGSWS
jgi:hypothetical protein